MLRLDDEMGLATIKRGNVKTVLNFIIQKIDTFIKPEKYARPINSPNPYIWLF